MVVDGPIYTPILLKSAETKEKKFKSFLCIRENNKKYGDGVKWLSNESDKQNACRLSI